MFHKHFKHYSKDLPPTTLTWEEKNPTSYLFDAEEVEKILERCRKMLDELEEDKKKS